MNSKSLKKKFRRAIKKNEIDKIVHILSKKSKVIDLEEHLTLAIHSENVELIELLLKNGAKLEKIESQTIDSLILLIFDEKNLDTLKDMLNLLIRNGLDPALVGKYHLRKFILSVKKDTPDAVEIAEILTKSGTLLNLIRSNKDYLFHHCIRTENIALIRFFIDAGADVNETSDNIFFPSPLLTAVDTGDVDTIDLILSRGADINFKDNSGWSVLHVACFLDDAENQDEVIRFLIERGAEINVENKLGQTPLALLFDCKRNPDDENIEVMVRELSKLDFEKVSLHEADFYLMRNNSRIREKFERCRIELKTMRDTKFYGVYSYYSMLRMSKGCKKLAHLTKNREFVDSFKENLSSFACYKKDLMKILEDATRVRDDMTIVQSRLKSVLGSLPDVVIRKLTENLTVEDLPLD